MWFTIINLCIGNTLCYGGGEFYERMKLGEEVIEGIS